MQFSFRSISRRIPSWLAALAVCASAVAFLPSCKKETPAETAKPALDLSTPKKASTALAKAVMTGDSDMMQQAAIGTPAQFAMMKSMSDMFTASARVHAAAVQKFGDKGKVIGEMPDLVAIAEKDDEKIDGDKATMINKDAPTEAHPMTLKKDGGNWKVDLSAMPTDKVPDSKIVKKMVDAMDGVAKDIGGGKYKTPEEANAALQAAMGAAALVSNVI